MGDERIRIIAIGRDRGRLGGHGRSGAAGPAGTAEADTDGRADRARERDATGDVEPARAAPAAHRLRDEPARGRTVRGDGLQRGRIDRTGAAAAAARTAEAHPERPRRRAAEADVPSDVEAARTAATAERLRGKSIGLTTMGLDLARSRRHDRARAAAARTRATETDPDRSRCAAADVEAAGHIEATRAAAAAHRLHEEGFRLVAFSRDRVGGRGEYGPTTAAGAARPADADPDAAADAAGEGQAAGDVEATVAAAAAHRLHDDTPRAQPARRHEAFDRRAHGIAIAAAAARAAEPDADRAAVRATERDRPRDVEPARTPAAADGLEQRATRIIAEGRDVAADRSVHRAAVAATTAGSTEADRDRGRSHTAKRRGAGHVEARITAAAADRLDDRAARMVAVGGDLPIEVAGDLAARATIAARTADSDRNTERDPVGHRRSGRDRIATRTAAAADRLRQQAGGEIALCLDRPAGIDVDDAAGPAVPPRSADRRCDARRDGETARCRCRDRETACAAAPADRFCVKALGEVARGADENIAIDVDAATGAAAAARPSDRGGDGTEGAPRPLNRASAGPAAAADRLGEEAAGIVALR